MRTAGNRLLATAVVALVAAAAVPASAHAQKQPPAYPMWFVQPPVVPGVVTAVGMAPRYSHVESSVDEATAAAHKAILSAMKSRVQVDMLSETIGGSKESRGESYQETTMVDSGSVRFVDLDTAVVGDLVFVLSATSRNVTVDDSPVRMAATPPTWVTAIPKDDPGIVVVGSAPLYFYENNSWAEAEARARRAAAFEFQSKTKALLRLRGDEAYRGTGGVTSMSTDAVLENALVVRRWRDANVCYVMMRVEAAAPGGSH
jgi:hypothetical protein